MPDKKRRSGCFGLYTLFSGLCVKHKDACRILSMPFQQINAENSLVEQAFYAAKERELNLEPRISEAYAKVLSLETAGKTIWGYKAARYLLNEALKKVSLFS